MLIVFLIVVACMLLLAFCIGLPLFVVWFTRRPHKPLVPLAATTFATVEPAPDRRLQLLAARLQQSEDNRILAQAISDLSDDPATAAAKVKAKA